jgi:TolA-binding protein
MKYFWRFLVNGNMSKYPSFFSSFFRLIVGVGVLAIFLFIQQSCSTEKNTWVNRTFHSTHAKYNGFFNANEIIKLTYKDFELNYVENYDKILPVFIYPNEEQSKAFYPPMDTADAKCERVIVKHAMPNKKVGQHKRTEWARWIDENWMTRGQSKFHKRDFSRAMEIFNYVEKNYPDRESTYKARLWKAKVHIELGEYIEAKKILDALMDKQTEIDEEKNKKKEDTKTTAKKPTSSSKKKSKGKKPTSSSKKKTDNSDKKAAFPRDFGQQLWPIYADLYLRQEDYEKAKEALNKAIEIVENRSFKTRLIFILAQINHKQGLQEASDLYELVVKRNPKYDMQFNAKINRALAFSGGDTKGIKAELIKMLKDIKNVSFKDQIYYALGELELRENNINGALDYFEKSVASSTSNPNQKTKSFLKLGSLHYQQKNYIKAQQYYDSTMNVLDKTHPEYEAIAYRSESLTELVTNLNKAQGQDSLLKLCDLSANELEKKIYLLIEAEQKRIDEEEEKKKNALADLPPPTTGSGTGKFWPYDPNLRALGYNDFKKVWGDRKNDDDWRRKDKSSELGEESAAASTTTNPKLTPEYYLKDLPCNDLDKKMKASEDIVQGWYGAAQVYKNKLKDDVEAIEAFKNCEKYLPHEKSVASLYQLYLLLQSKGNTAQADGYKNKLLSDYPDSEYAKLIKNPNLFQNESDEAKKEEKEYELIYTSYKKGFYGDVISRCNAKIAEKENPYLCKYLYLKTYATAYGNNTPEDLSSVEAALEELISLCKDEDMLGNAKLLLDRLKNQQSVMAAKSGAGSFIYATDAKHMFVLVFPNTAGSVNQAKIKVSDFNDASFSSKNLEIKSSFLDADNQVITVKPFEDKKAAMDYYVAFKVNKTQVQSLNSVYQYFIITEKNFASLFVEKNLNEYLEFFTKNYGK